MKVKHKRGENQFRSEQASIRRVSIIKEYQKEMAANKIK